MSYDFVIRTTRSAIPSADALRAELARQKPSVTSERFDNWQASTGYFSVEIDGRATGFEMFLASNRPSQIARLEQRIRDGEEADHARRQLENLRTHDTRIHLLCKDDLEIAAARLVAGALAVLTGGELADPQTGTIVHGTYLP